MKPIVLSVFIAAAHAAAAVSLSAQSPSPPVRLLDIPYIQQSEALCGGAAAAMVMRYWGATDVRAETFEGLVDRAAGGIRAQDLLDDLRRRGWRAESFRGDAALVRQQLAERRPVVALIEDRPGAFHFVVIAAWVNGRVLYHDPARAPFRVVSEAAFEAVWQPSDRWTMVVLPGPGVQRTEADTAAAAPPPTDSACGRLVGRAVEIAKGGDRATALGMLASAADVCPNDSAPYRESAGIHALDERWTEAATQARAAVARNPQDQLAWQILAASEFVNGDPAAALEAWNAVGEPRIDLVTVQGLTRTRHSVATTLLDLPPGAVLTAERLAAAGKRLAELPAADVARVTYRPQPGGRANVEATVVERPLLPTSTGSLLRIGVDALVDRELAVTASSITGGGDTVSAAWRWWEHRPRISVQYAAPSPLGLVSAEVFGEEQTYGREGAAIVESRRGGRMSLANWTTGLRRWEASTGVDAWGDERTTASIGLDLDQRVAGDRVALRASGALLAGSFTAWTSRIGAEWRSRRRHEGTVLLADGGFDLASGSSPLALWAGAGTGQGRAALLRAHPLLDDGRITSEVFGRRLYHASGELRRWLPPVRRILGVAPAVFVDAARATHRREPGDAWHVDAGIGIRFAAGGSVLRLDLAKGLRDGATAVSIGWTR